MRLALICVAVLVGVMSANQPSHAQPAPDDWIIDTDMGLDDALAVAFVLNHPNANVLAITVAGTGVGICPGVADDARALVDFVAEGTHDIPVACGARFPLDGYHALPPAWRGVDLDVQPTRPVGADTKDQPTAAELIVSTLRAAETPVSILSIAPQTNLAQAFTMAPDIVPKVREIVMMGGAIHADGNVGQPGAPNLPANTRSEWNVFIDPLASAALFASGVPMRVVPLDATSYARVEPGLIAAMLPERDTPLVGWARKIVQAIVDAGQDEVWDPVAASVALDRSVCEYEMAAIVIGTETATDGWSSPGEADTFPKLNWWGQPRHHFATATAGAMSIDTESGHWVFFCSRPDMTAFAESFRRVLSGAAE